MVRSDLRHGRQPVVWGSYDGGAGDGSEQTKSNRTPGLAWSYLDKALLGLVLILREKVFLSMLDNSTSRGKGESGLGLGLGRY